MTIRTLFVTATLCSILTLTGCATKEAVKIDLAGPPTALTTTTAAQDPSGTETIGDGLTGSVGQSESIPTAGGAMEQIDGAGIENRLAPIYFDFDSYLLSGEARNILTHNARWLAENQHVRVIIEGHSDERGSDEYNLALSEKRALTARRYIETLGTNLDRLGNIGYGEEKPAVTGHDEVAWAKNRRVEFVIVK
ncbi:MAG: peptidoglycan-associated lipoprotein [Desulfuromonadaceae bacterium]